MKQVIVCVGLVSVGLLSMTSAEFVGEFYVGNKTTAHRALAGGNRCYMAPGWDVTGADIDQPRAQRTTSCCGLCEAASAAGKRCDLAVWTNYTGGTCWLKSPSIQYTYKAGSYMMVNLPDDSLPRGIKFFDCDFPGNDLRSFRSAKTTACGDECIDEPACRAYTRSDFEGGTCWLKAASASCVKVAGRTSFFLFK